MANVSQERAIENFTESQPFGGENKKKNYILKTESRSRDFPERMLQYSCCHQQFKMEYMEWNVLVAKIKKSTCISAVSINFFL